MGNKHLRGLEEAEALTLGWIRLLTQRGSLAPFNAEDANRLTKDLVKAQGYMRALIDELQAEEFREWANRTTTPATTPASSKPLKSASRKTKTDTSSD